MPQTKNLIENAHIQGITLKEKLNQLKNEFSFIGDVRGKGLLVAFELVANKETMEPLPTSMNADTLLVEEAYKKGLIIYSRKTRGGTIGDHFMICPPLVINKKQIDEICLILRECLKIIST